MFWFFPLYQFMQGLIHKSVDFDQILGFLCIILQLFAMPVFDMIETVLVKKLHFRPTTTLRFISRNVYVGKYI